MYVIFGVIKFSNVLYSIPNIVAVLKVTVYNVKH